MDGAKLEERGSAQLITLPQLAAETKKKVCYWYERSRHGNIPGLVRIGKFIRIDRERFYAALRGEEAT